MENDKAGMLLDAGDDLSSLVPLIAAREQFLTQAAGAQIEERYITSSYFDAPRPNTSDGCLILPFVKQLALDESGVRVSFPADAPREEVAAVLRHLLTGLETDTCPPFEPSGSFSVTASFPDTSGDGEEA